MRTGGLLLHHGTTCCMDTLTHATNVANMKTMNMFLHTAGQQLRLTDVIEYVSLKTNWFPYKPILTWSPLLSEGPQT